MLSLLDLGKKHGTDKVVHAYLPHYAERFQRVRHDAIRVLEIGVFEGGSLRMWQEYFPQGQIFGLDAVKDYCFSEERIRCVCGRQENMIALQRVIDLSGPLDIVIDDGGHAGTQHVRSFEFLWPHVKPGGWYCVEDAITLFDICWTQPDHRTVLHIVQERWEKIVRSDCDIAEVAIVGCDTQKDGGRNNGLIFLRKAEKEAGHA